MNKIKEIIERRIKEHRVEADLIEKEVNLLKESKDIKNISKIIIFKDKIVFHKAGMVILTDLLKEINNELSS